MQRATPVQMRQALELVEACKQAGIRFVPIPAVDEEDFLALTAEMLQKIERIARLADASSNPGCGIKGGCTTWCGDIACKAQNTPNALANAPASAGD